jgi:hypothetical protein
MSATDPYLSRSTATKRLIKEYLQYGVLYIGVDFDNTIYDCHRKGCTHEQVIKLVRDLHEIGCIIVLWTCHQDLNNVKNYLQEKDIQYEGINTDGHYLGWPSRKPFFSAILDDRAGLDSVFESLTEVVRIGKQNKINKK